MGVEVITCFQDFCQWNYEVIGDIELVDINHTPAFYRARWLAKATRHDMFKARDANVWQREFPVGFPVEISALNSIFITFFMLLLLV